MSSATSEVASRPRTVRGVLGEKVGMTQLWDDRGRLTPVTVVRVGPNVVTQVRTPDKDGYAAVQLAYGAIDPRKVTKPESGHFEKAGVTPRRYTIEVRTDDATDYELGQELTAEVFEAGAKVDVTATSKGKGFAGVMKRHGFSGMKASHGVEKVHRTPGAIGGCATPSRVFKGTRLPGRMGGVRVTTQGLTVQSVDTDNGIVLVKGAVPGPRGGLVLIRSTSKAKGGGSQ